MNTHTLSLELAAHSASTAHHCFFPPSTRTPAGVADLLMWKKFWTERHAFQLPKTLLLAARNVRVPPSPIFP